MIDYENLNGLTVVEFAVKELIEKGWTKDKVARTIGITPPTLTKHIKKLIKAEKLSEETLHNKEETDNFGGKSIHRKCMDKYYEFVENRIGVAPKIDGREGKALKDIISYLEGAIKRKKGGVGAVTEDEILYSWEYILSNWNRLGSFYSRRIKLSNINSDIVNILSEVKRGGTKQNTAGGRSSLKDKLRS